MAQHTCELLLATKMCTKCGIVKSLDLFPLKHGKPQVHCKACNAEYHRAWRAKPENKARANARSAEWRLANLEREKECNKAWREANPERKSETGRTWWATAGRFNADYERRAENNRLWRERNPERWAAHNRAAVALRRALRAAAPTVPFTNAQLDARLAYYGHRCWICKTGPYEHLDHVKPLSKGGSHMLSNLRPACASCNSSKRATWPFTPAD